MINRKAAEFVYKSGNLYLNQGKYRSAINDLKIAIKLDPTYAKAFSNLGVAYKRAGLYRKAIRMFHRALDLTPGEAGIYNNLGNVYCSVHEYETAIKYYEKAIALDPTNREAYYNLGSIYYFSGQTGKALDLLAQSEQIKQEKNQALATSTKLK